MEDKVFENSSPGRGQSLEQVTTHFGSLETERIPMVISLEGLPDADEYEKVVDSFYENLKSDHPYQYQDVIGEGGMGIVEKVKDKKCLRSIAKKTLNPAKCDKESIIRFTEEAQITAQLEHPNIVPVYEMGMNDKNRLFYTMKMVKGRNLKEVLRLIKKGDEEIIKKFPLSRLLEIFTAVCDAMSYACSKRIVHRDLKPDNIMVGDYGEIYIVDWGLAKIIKNNAGHSTEQIPEWIVKEVYAKQDVSTDKFLKELRRIDSLRTKDQELNISFNDVLIGTPQYMAPERISGEADECSEVYALGAILYNILTLELTVEGDDLEEIVTKIFNEDIKSPLKFNKLPHLEGGKVPPSLAAVCMKALSAEPVERYHTVAQLRKEISAWEDGFITEAEKAGLGLVIWSNIKRNKIESSIAATFFILLVCIYAFYAVNLQKDMLLAEESENIALTQKRIAEEETKKLSEKSKAITEKIQELESMAPDFYRRSLSFINSNDLEKAAQTINDAIKLKRHPKYHIVQGNILQSLYRFEDSVKAYEQILKERPDSAMIKNALNFSKARIDKPIVSYVDKLIFRDFLISQKRFPEAAIMSRKLLDDSKNMKMRILRNLKQTNLSFIRSKHLEITDNGELYLTMPNLGITDISALKGIPFHRLNINNNPISDISALEGMPLESLDISSTKVTNLKALSKSALKVFVAYNTPISNLEGLENSPLVRLDIANTKVSSLSRIKTYYLKHLIMSSTNVESLEGLNFKSLRELNISKTQINSLLPLKGSQLTSLIARQTKIKSLEPLAKTFLKTLDASECDLDNFSYLRPLPLEKLLLDDTNLEDLSFLAGKKLNFLSIEGTKVKKIQHLRGMPISSLNLSKTQINDLSPISELPLENLTLNRCKFRKLPQFTNMSEMASIHLKNAKITELPFLGNRNYRILDLSRSSIQNIDSLKNCTVQHLDLSFTNLTDLSALKGKSFKGIILDHSKVSDLSPLSESLIDRISVSRTAVSDLSPLKKSNVVQLNGHGLKIKSLDFVNKQTIKNLDIPSSTISDLSPLEGSNLEILNLAHSSIKKLNSLEHCSQLKSLDLYGTEISSIEPIINLPLQALVLGDCKNLKNIVQVKKMKNLKKIIIPNHIKDLDFLRSAKNLRIIGTSSNHHNQPAALFWEKYDKKAEK